MSYVIAIVGFVALAGVGEVLQAHLARRDRMRLIAARLREASSECGDWSGEGNQRRSRRIW